MSEITPKQPELEDNLLNFNLTQQDVERMLPQMVWRMMESCTRIPFCGVVAEVAPWPMNQAGQPIYYLYGPPFNPENSGDHFAGWPRMTDAGEQRVDPETGVIYRWDAYTNNAQMNEGAAWAGLTSCLSVSVDGLQWMAQGCPIAPPTTTNDSKIMLGYAIDRDNILGQGKGKHIGYADGQFQLADRYPGPYTATGKGVTGDDIKYYFDADNHRAIAIVQQNLPNPPGNSGFLTVYALKSLTDVTKIADITASIQGITTTRTECPGLLRMIDQVTGKLVTVFGCALQGGGASYTAATVLEGDAVVNAEKFFSNGQHFVLKRLTYGFEEYAPTFNDRQQLDGTGGTSVGTNFGHFAIGRYNWWWINSSAPTEVFGTAGGAWLDDEIYVSNGNIYLSPDQRFKKFLPNYQHWQFRTDGSGSALSVVITDLPQNMEMWQVEVWLPELLPGTWIAFRDSNYKAKTFGITGSGTLYESTGDLPGTWPVANEDWMPLTEGGSKLIFRFDHGWLCVYNALDGVRMGGRCFLDGPLNNIALFVPEGSKAYQTYLFDLFS